MGLFFVVSLLSIFPYGSTQLSRLLSVGSTYIAVGSMALWIFIVFISRPSFWIRSVGTVQLTLFFVIYASVVPYLFGNESLGNRYLGLGLMYFFLWVDQFNREFGSQQRAYRVAVVIAVLALITMIVTVNALKDNSFASRMIKTSGEYSDQARLSGVGGYEFIYFLVYVFVFLFFMAINSKAFRFSTVVRVTCGILSVSVLVCIVMSNYFTALLLSALSAAIIILFKRGSMVGKILAILVLFFLAFFVKPVMKYTVLFVSELTGESSKTTERLGTVDESLSSDSSTSGESSNRTFEMLMERFPTLRSSLIVAFENPVAGLTIQKSMMEQTMGDYAFGNHSYFLDTIALFGFPIGFLCVYISIKPLLRKRRHKSVVFIGLRVSMVSCTFILFVFNTATASIGLAVYFLYPTLVSYLERRMALSKFRKISVAGRK